MISEGVKHYCSEPLDHIENYDIASTDQNQVWHIHHRLEISLKLSKNELIERNLYYNRPASELIFMRSQEHKLLHNSQASFRAAMSVAQKEAQNRPEIKAKRSASLKEANSRPEVKAKRSAAMKGKSKSPEHKAKISAAMKEAMNRPETKAKQSAAQKEAQNRPETKAKRIAALKEVLNRPETKARMSAAQNRPETKEKISAALKDRISINNGSINKRVKTNELNNYIANGWVYGRLPYKK